MSKDGVFVAGHKRHVSPEFNFNMSMGYEFDKKSKYKDERVLYGGIIIDVFGHSLTEAFSRLWYLQEVGDNNIPIVFLTNNLKYNIPDYFYKMAELLGIEKDRIIISREVVQYREIIVPDQAWMLFIGFNRKIVKLYEAMGKKACEKTDIEVYEKVYLSRKYAKTDCINEEYFENFYRERGFKIIYPETLPFHEQVAIASRAKELVCTAGTLSHFILFAPSKCKTTILLRCNEAGALLPQCIINQMKNINVIWIDIALSFLPTTHACGVHLIGPTKDFTNYLSQENISHSMDELQMNYEKTVWEYVKTWIEYYSRNTTGYKRIKEMDCFDVVNYMSQHINEKSLSREAMQTPDRKKQLKELETMKSQYKMVYVNKKRDELVIEDILDNPEYKNSKIAFGLETKVKQPFVIWKMHIAHRGWSDWCVQGEKMNISEYSGEQMEAMQIEIMNCNDLEINYSAYSKKSGWSKKIATGEFAGTTGKSDPIMAIKIEVSDVEPFHIMYRVGYRENWSQWYQDGEVTDMNVFPCLERMELKIVYTNS